MVPARLRTVGKRNNLEGEPLTAKHAQLAIAYQVNRRRTDARERTKCNQRSPDFAPVLVGNADSLHGSSSPEDRIVLMLECTEKNVRGQPVPGQSRTTGQMQETKAA